MTREQAIARAILLLETFAKYGMHETNYEDGSKTQNAIMAEETAAALHDLAIAGLTVQVPGEKITAKFLEECGYVMKGGPRLTFQGGDNIAPTAVEHYNPKTGHAVLEFVGVPTLLLEKGKEQQYVKRLLYWAALTPESNAATQAGQSLAAPPSHEGHAAGSAPAAPNERP